jgi:hypothetical protein
MSFKTATGAAEQCVGKPPAPSIASSQFVRTLAAVRLRNSVGLARVIADVREGSCRLRGIEVAEGEMLWITLPAVGAVRAKVRWSHSGMTGCEFVTPLSSFLIASMQVESNLPGGH